MSYIHGYFDVNTGEIIETPFTQQEIIEAQKEAKIYCQSINKQQAKNLLAQTDWTTIADVTNPALSNPYLANSAEFIDYRNQLRAIVFNPPDTEIVFPVIPQEVWQAV